MRHRVIHRLALLAAVAAIVTTGGCDGRRNSAPEDPSLQPAFGARVTDGRLQIWTGSRCVGVEEVTISFDMYDTVTELTATAPGGAEVDRLTLGGPYPGFRITKPLPAGFDWTTADLVTLQVKGNPDGFGSSSKVAEIVSGSPSHPADTYWFEGSGWLTASDVAEKDGKTFLATCTPDPQARR